MENAMLNVNSFELTLEQEFIISAARQSAENLTREQIFEILMQNLRLAMVKDNIIRDLVKDKILHAEI